ncbi:unnamed protein product [Linum tenue]|uniref:protein-serine/threonine phosphatase n=1 Tax=Linum tenue TaxID=586396 RepID=A0AAV0QPB8_9ROSI|nr:unnamed protein product [Linum tenue]
MNQFVLTKTINARRRRLRIRRLKYTCESPNSHDLTATLSPALKEKDKSSSSPAAAVREISVLLTATSAPAEKNDSNSDPGNDAVSCGSASAIGGRKEMEDAVAVELGFKGGYDFFGVYDGHGGAGVAEACRERLHELLAEEIGAGVAAGAEWGGVMERCFGRMDGMVEEKDRMVGSTAVVAVVGKEEVVVANCGDSRAVLCRGGGVVVPLSSDHKPDRPDELERVEAAGGRVINWNGYRVLGVLSTSRSIGDEYLKPFIISTPEVVVTKRSPEDEFLILGSDGLWDVISNEDACQVVRRCLKGRMRRRRGSSQEPPAAEAAAVLAELAMAQGSKDNISVIVVELNNINGGNSS